MPRQRTEPRQHADHVREHYQASARHWRIVGDEKARERLAALTGLRFCINPPERLYIEYVAICRQLGVEPATAQPERIELNDI